MRKLYIAFICLGLLILACCSTVKEHKGGMSSHEQSTDIKRSNSLPARQHPLQTTTAQRELVPSQLEIPVIGLKAPVEKVGKLPGGAMDVPHTFDRVGLLYPAILPGQNGNAVIDGHVDHYTGPAVFFYLKKLKPGDKVIVSEQGASLTFVVKSVEAFNIGEAPLDRIFGPADRPLLNLITCTGKFNKRTQEHDKRLVVFTEIERQ